VPAVSACHARDFSKLKSADPSNENASGPFEGGVVKSAHLLQLFACLSSRVCSVHCSRLFICFVVVPLATSAAAECLKANVEGQAAQGQLTIGRARDAAGRLERPYILRLTSDACLDSDDADDVVKSTRTIHVFPAEEKLQLTFRRLVGRPVAVRGSPFTAHTSHHHAPIVMQVSEIGPR
jgi:hypothetical protein